MQGIFCLECFESILKVNVSNKMPSRIQLSCVDLKFWESAKLKVKLPCDIFWGQLGHKQMTLVKLTDVF